MQLNKLRQKLEAIARELEVADKETFLSSVATEHGAELASSQLFKPSGAAPSGPADTVDEAESNGRLKPRERRPKKQMKPKVDELEEAEKKPRLFEPAAGPPPKVGEEELAAEGSGQEILLQGFNWESWKQGWYHKLMDQADEIADMGITCIWLPPPTDSVSPQGYMPGDLYNLNSKYGSQEDLKRCVDKLQSKGLKVLCDIVINHRCAQQQDKSGIWNVFGGKMAWDAKAIVVNDRKFKGRGNRATGDEFAAAPNIDHMQDYVRKDLTEWLEWLRDDIGFDGWRFDFVRGYGGQFVREYVLATEPHFVVGEYWDSLDYDGNVPKLNQDRHRQQTIDWITAAGGAATAFDVTTKGILHAVFEKDELNRLRDEEGRPPGVMGWWPSRATTFLENHDTGSTQGHWRFPKEGHEQGLVYLMTHPGIPCMFYDDLQDRNMKDLMRRLIALRQAAGIHCRSKVYIMHAQKFLYVAEIDGSLLMKIGKAKYEPDSTKWKPLESGKDWGIWQKA
ncbi:alpha-amylase [Trebouxia sp. C0010 RCD-2024]